MIALIIIAYLMGVFIAVGYILESEEIHDLPLVVIIAVFWPLLLPIFFLIGMGSAFYNWVHSHE